MANPSDMTDEELQTVIETGVEPDEPTTEEVSEEQPSEEVTEDKPKEEVQEETEVTPTEEVKQEDETPEEKPPSRRETLRIQKLLAKYGDPDKKAPKPLQPKPSEQIDYKNELDADPEVIQRLEADRQAYGQLQQNEAMKRAEYLSWETSLKIDAPIVEKKYPILDKDSPEFHPAVANAINTWYLKMSGYDADNQTVANRDISYKDFVEANMELVEEIAGQKNINSVKNIAKQAATTGLRPDGSSAKRLNLNKNPSDMTNEELYASIGNLGKPYKN